MADLYFCNSPVVGIKTWLWHLERLLVVSTLQKGHRGERAGSIVQMSWAGKIKFISLK